MKRGALKSSTNEHCHITTRKDISGGKPIIKGTRTSVSHIAGYYLLGLSPEEIKKELPYLSMAQIFDALAFYFDHREEMDKDTEQDMEEKVASEYSHGKY
ncbi:MAG: DUF433 domain-containing protein [Candidatus Kuenenia sp.]|nr:DUF433 domain-containing protein [Candidatus Kuenenia sp.]